MMIDGHHVQYYDYHGAHLIIDGKNIGYYGGEVTSQNKSARTVADISVSGTKLRVSYSDGTSKDIDVPSSGFSISRIEGDGVLWSGPNSIMVRGSDSRGNSRGKYTIYFTRNWY